MLLNTTKMFSLLCSWRVSESTGFNLSVKYTLHNILVVYQIREKTAQSFVDFIKVYFFICNDLQCLEYAL